MQELWSVVQVWDASAETRRMLLRARLHVRSVVHVPSVMWLCEHGQEVIP